MFTLCRINDHQLKLRQARLRELDFAMATSFPGHVVEAQPEVVFHHEGLCQVRIIPHTVYEC